MVLYLNPDKLLKKKNNNFLVATSVQWYAWSPTNSTSPAVQPQSRLCQSCWSYWKKYGDLTVPIKVGATLPSCSDDDAKNLTGGESSSRPHRCSIQGCGKVS